MHTFYCTTKLTTNIMSCMYSHIFLEYDIYNLKNKQLHIKHLK